MSYIVTLTYDPMWLASEWVKENCCSYITSKARKEKHLAVDPVTDDPVIDYEYVIDYYFGDKHDATIFSLRWA